MVSKLRHFLQICLHITALAEQLVTEQAVYCKDSRTTREITADILNRAAHNSLIVRQFQHNQDIRIIYLTETRKRVALNLFYRNNAGVVTVDFSKRILECLCQNLFVRYVQNAFVDLLGRLAVQRSDYIIFFVRVRCFHACGKYSPCRS